MKEQKRDMDKMHVVGVPWESTENERDREGGTQVRAEP